MTDPQAAAVIVETEPDLKDVQLLEDWLYEFNVQATGIDDGKLLSLFLRRRDGSILAAPMAGAGVTHAICAISSFQPNCGTRATARG